MQKRPELVEIADEGTVIALRRRLNFVGAGVSVADDPVNDEIDITIAGSGGGGDSITVDGVAATDPDFVTGTGDIDWALDTVPAPDTIIGTVINNAITFAKMADLATDRLIGRDTALTGDPEALTVGGGIEFTGAGGLQTSAFTGDVTKAAGGTAQTIPANQISNAMLRDSAGFSVIGKPTTGTGDPADIVAADETVLGRTAAGNVAFAQVATGQVSNNAVTFAKLQDIASDSLIGRDTAASGDPEAITLNATLEFTGAGAIQRAALTGDVTASAGGNATTIANDAVTYAKIQNVSAASRLVGRGSAAEAGDPEEIILGTNLSMSGTTLNATGGGGSANVGQAALNFGTFPGVSDASVAVTGQTGIVAGSIVNAWIRPEATADHSADEHMVETLKIFAANIVAGAGFTIYGFNTSQLNEPVGVQTERQRSITTAAQQPGTARTQARNSEGGAGTRIYGQWTVAWSWN